MRSIRTESALQARHKFIGTQKNLILQFLPQPWLILFIGHEIHVAPYGLASLFQKEQPGAS